MKPIFFYLGSCSTCNRILAELPKEKLTLHEIKTEPITEAQLEAMAALAGSYEALFSRRALKYRSLGLDKKELSEGDYKQYILEEYTFLKRPVLLATNQVFVGNSKKNVEAMQRFLGA